VSYSTLDSVTKKIDQVVLIQLLNDEVRDSSVINLSDPNDLVVQRFEEAASSAQAEIDPYLRGRYTLPLSPVPEIIIDISDDITIYNCHKRRGDIPEDRTENYKMAVKKLDKIGTGKMDIGVANEPQQISNEIKTNKTASDREFNDDMWSKY